NDYSFTGTSRFGWTVAYAAILCTLAYGFGLPDVPRSRRAALGAAVGASFLGAAAISLIQLFVGDALLPRFVVFGSALLLPDWYRLCVGFAVGGRSRAEARDRVLLVATPEELAALELELEASPERPASILRALSIDEASSVDAHSPMLEPGADRPTVVVLDRDAQEVPRIVAQAGALHADGVRVRSLTLFYEEWLGKLPISELERASMLFDIGEVHRAAYGRAKRLLDIPLAVVGGLALLLVIPFVWLGNLVGGRGPLFYRQPRVGKGGVPFSIVKFRTMVPRPSGELVNEWTTEDDPRITRFGRVLRKTHLDELPQVVNILKGELGVVGPRPEQPQYVAELEAKLPFYGLRHLVRPGLTGWAQVKYGYAGNESDALQKLQYEFWYLRHQSIRTDARIIGRTIRSVFGSDRGQGR
ncbi:MAG: sugar transferase, partial [Chloroflexota bacterium]|nr:sugar transferase [Chloroflexota bacterium]